MSKTAMQEFGEWLKAYEYELPLELQVKAKECLELEKEQIIKAVEDTRSNIVPRMFLRENLSGEQYFKQTYKQNK